MKLGLAYASLACTRLTRVAAILRLSPPRPHAHLLYALDLSLFQAVFGDAYVGVPTVSDVLLSKPSVTGFIILGLMLAALPYSRYSARHQDYRRFRCVRGGGGAYGGCGGGGGGGGVRCADRFLMSFSFPFSPPPARFVF